MAFGRGSSEQRAAQRQAQGARQAEELRARLLAQAEEAFWESPRGQARAAKLAGQRWFQIDLPIEETGRPWDSWLLWVWDVETSARRAGEQGLTLTEIEDEGWELVNAGWVAQEAGAVTRDKFLWSGRSIKITGLIFGVYLFKATEADALQDEPWVRAVDELDARAGT